MMARSLVLLVLLAVSCRQVAAIKCYMCNSLTNEHCGDPVDSSRLETTECTLNKAKDFMNKMSSSLSNFVQNIGLGDIFPPGADPAEMACQKMKYTEAGGKEVVMRSCIPADSNGMCTDSFSSKESFFCDQCKSDGCNGAGQLGAFPLFFYILLPCIVAVLTLTS